MGLFAVVQVFAGVPDVANHNHLHASLVERRNQVVALLMQDVLNLTFDFSKGAALGVDELFAPP